MGSVYCRRESDSSNITLQQQCHQQYRGVFTPEAVREVLMGMLTKVMTASHVLTNQREFGDELVFEDV